MSTITIQVAGDELEVLNVELTTEEVTALYKLRKDNATRIAELEKQLKSETDTKEMHRRSSTGAQAEIDEANTLLTALGVQEKTSHEEAYYRKTLKIATRIALYIANVKTTV